MLSLARIKDRPYTTLGVVLLALLAVPFCLRRNGDWTIYFLPAAHRLATGDNLFQAGYTYPPLMAWLTVPFTWLPPAAARLALHTANALAVLVVLRGAWQLAGGGRLQGPGVARREHLVAALGLAVAVFAWLSCYSNQQTDLLIAALLTLGCLALHHGWPLRGAVCLGIAAGCKCTPLLFAAYLAWRRHFLAAAAVPLVAVGVNLLPELTHPGPEARTRLGRWCAEYLATTTHRDPGTWASGLEFNHSVAGVLQRWTTATLHFQHGNTRTALRPDRLPPRPLKLAVYSCCLLLVGLALWSARLRGRTCPDELGPALEMSLVLLLMLALSPMSSLPHYCTLVLPGFCLARLAIVHRHRPAAACLAVAVTGSLLCGRDVLGPRLYALALWHGLVIAVALALFTGCCLALRWRPTPQDS